MTVCNSYVSAIAPSLFSSGSVWAAHKYLYLRALHANHMFAIVRFDQIRSICIDGEPAVILSAGGYLAYNVVPTLTEVAIRIVLQRYLSSLPQS